MSGLRLILRNLAFNRGATATAVLGVALATAVLLGSLVVGDSVKQTVRRKALARLGHIDVALQSPDMFSTTLAGKLSAHEDLKRHLRSVVPALIVDGSVQLVDGSRTAPQVRLVGVPDGFWPLFDRTPPNGFDGRAVAVSESLAVQLGLEPGQPVLIQLQRRHDTPAGSLFEYRTTRHTRRSTRTTISEVLPDDGVGGFTLETQTLPERNVFMPLDRLAQLVGKPEAVNTLLMEIDKPDVPLTLDRMQQALNGLVSVDDLGLKLTIAGDTAVVESHRIVLSGKQVRAVQGSKIADIPARRVSVYLADRLHLADHPERTTHYAVMAGIDPAPAFAVVEGTDRLASEDEMLLNRWAATDMKASVGDRIEISYRVANPDGSYTTSRMPKTLVGIVDVSGPGADRSLVPTFPGITDAETIADWDSPFPIDMDKVTPRDEAYWEAHRAAPKVFLRLSVVRNLWGGPNDPLNGLTSLRLTLPDANHDAAIGQLRHRIRQNLTPADVGMVFRPVRQLALKASNSPTDFAMLFASMSFFIIVAALALTASLQRLSVRQRAAQVGIMQACGWPARRTHRLLWAEGTVIGLVGALLGLPLGLAWAWLIVTALNSYFSAAAAGTALTLSVVPASCVIGTAGGWVAAAASSAWAIRRLGRQRTLDLLGARRRLQEAVRPSGRLVKAVAVVCPLAVVGLLGGLAAGLLTPETAFFPAGAALLAGGLALMHLAMSAMRGRTGTGSLLKLAWRNASGNRLRSLLVAGLIAASSFVLVAVAANRRDYGALESTHRHGPTGGFELAGRSSMPMPVDPGTVEGRRRLGFDESEQALFEGVTTYGLLLKPGQDISCLNLARAVEPALLGAGPRFVKASPFSLTVGADAPDNPWNLLTQELQDGDIPVIGDAASVRWQMQKGLGDLVVITAGDGQPVKLRIVGLIDSSFIAGQLIVSEKNLRRLFPSVVKPGYFLFDVPADRLDAVQGALQHRLGPLGLDVRRTTELLNDLIAVQNTYLSTFLVLGGLGLALGTVGVVTVLLRNAYERRSELAVMSASGFTRGQLARLLALENALLLTTGLGLGTASALLAMAGQLASPETQVNWVFLALVLVSIGAVGMIAGGLSAHLATSGRLLDALRSE